MNGHKYGNPKLIKSVATVSADVIAVGDLLWQDSSNSYAARPASAYTWDTNLATTQTSFKAVFLGVAMSAKPAGSTDTVRVATDGEHEFDIASATATIGTPMGPAKAIGNALENQKLVAAVITASISKVTKANVSAGTKIQVHVQGTLTSGAIT